MTVRIVYNGDTDCLSNRYIIHWQGNTHKTWRRADTLSVIGAVHDSYNSVRANPSTWVARSRSLRFRSCCYVAWSLTEASHRVSSLKREGSITCRVTGRQRRSPLEQGGLEVPCELTFSGTEQLTKNVRVHVRTITLDGRLPGCQHVLQGLKGMGGGRLCEHGCLPRRIRYYVRAQYAI